MGAGGGLGDGRTRFFAGGLTFIGNFARMERDCGVGVILAFGGEGMFFGGWCGMGTAGCGIVVILRHTGFRGEIKGIVKIASVRKGILLGVAGLVG